MRNNETDKLRAYNLLKSRKCIRCLGPVTRGRKNCMNCLKKIATGNKVRGLKNNENGRCYICNALLDVISPASTISKRVKRIRMHCKKCILKKASRIYLGGSNKWKSLLELLDRQNHVCAISGLKIDIGSSATIDHKTPKVLGGENKLENLQWVHRDINLMKRDHTTSEFLLLCTQILNYQKGTGDYTCGADVSLDSIKQLALKQEAVWSLATQ